MSIISLIAIFVLGVGVGFLIGVIEKFLKKNGDE